MSNRGKYLLWTKKSDVELVTAQLIGAGGADMVNGDAAKMGGGDVSAAVRTGAGTFTLALRKSWPQLLGGSPPLVVGTTAGLHGRFTAIDPVNKTATLKLEVGGVATDPAVTDTVYLNLLMRNSGRN